MNWKYPAVILSFTLLLTGARAQSSVLTDRAKADFLISRVRQLTGRVIPGKSGLIPKELEWNIKFLSTEDHSELRITKTAAGYQLYLPGNFNQWAFRPENSLMIVNTALSARAGSNELLQEPWITAALIHKIYETGSLYGTAGYGNDPYLRTMLAYGIAPETESILNTSFPALLSGISAANTMEWCALLMELSLAKHPQDVLERYLAENKKFSRLERFQTAVHPGKRKEQSKSVFRQTNLSLDQWFLSQAISKVLSRNTPAAVPWIEKQFQEISRETDILTQDITNKKLTDIQRSDLLKIINKIHFLAAASPENIALKLFSYADQLILLRKHTEGELPLPEITKAEQLVWTALSERADLEHRLKTAELRLIPPGTRLALTIQTVTPVQPHIPLLKKANELLDRFEKD